jgi:hypothetical protein
MFPATKFVTAVVAGVMTVGIGAANVVPVPEPDDSVVVAEADLTAITIPILNIDCCETGPLRVWRYLAIEAGTNPLLLGLIQNAGNTYDLPGLTTTFDSDTHWWVEANSEPGEFIDFGAMSERGQIGEWELLGIAGGSAEVTRDRNIHFRPLLGGSEGIGAGISGTLAHTTYTRNLSLFDSNLDLVGGRTIADFDGELALMPWDGFKAVGEGTLFDVAPRADFNLGSIEGGAGFHGAITGNGGLCLGSAQASCGNRISYLTIGAPVSGDVTLGDTTILSADFENNEVAIELRPGQFSVTGAVGGIFSIGSLDIGRQGGYPINIQIPNNSAVTSLNDQRQTQTVRNSFMAVPGKSASDNGSTSSDRRTVRDTVKSAISDVKTTVKTAVSNATGSKPQPTVKTAVSNATGSKPQPTKPDTEPNTEKE